jgi:hypothetical protein
MIRMVPAALEQCLDGWIMVSGFVVVEQNKMGLIPMEVFMLPAANHERVRLSISVPIETKTMYHVPCRQQRQSASIRFFTGYRGY